MDFQHFNNEDFKIELHTKLGGLVLQNGMFWLSEQRLVDQANTIHKNSWMTELEIEELERKVTGSDSLIVKKF